MEQIVGFIENIKSVQIVDVLVAICIMVLFTVLSPSISYIIVRLFKRKSKKKEIRNSAFYSPLKIFFSILGIYIAVVFLRESLNISKEIMEVVTKGFWIISTIAFSKALAQSFTMKSSLIIKYKETTEKDINDGMLKFSLKIVRIIIYVIAILIILIILKVNVGGIITGLGLGGVIITLAAQDTAKNIFGGIVIFLDRTFNVGDWIETQNYEGIVEGMTFRTTRIRNFENSVVNIPNSTMADTAIINWSKMEKRRYKIRLPFSFEITSEQMNMLKEKIEAMLRSNPETINDDILLSFDTISETNLSLLIDLFVKTTSYDDYERTKDKVNARILDIVHNSGMKLAYPASTVFLDNENNR